MFNVSKNVGHMCTIQIPYVGIIFVDHGGVMPMVKVHYVRFDIMKIFGCSLLMLKWMSTLFLCCYRDVGVSLLFISYFLWNFWTNKTWENEYSKTIFEATKHWNSFFTLFSMEQPNSLKAFFLPKYIFPLNYFTLRNSFTWSQTQPQLKQFSCQYEDILIPSKMRVVCQDQM